uniref:Uncharacterized protein n=1 Tax=Arundo donax TaxID=35708 RepID=A0A0A8YII7_ARUDO
MVPFLKKSILQFCVVQYFNLFTWNLKGVRDMVQFFFSSFSKTISITLRHAQNVNVVAL